jgi:prepilin-type N-terminal cleavage/methylation domain-containing protein/prepilin-type processing-associated H-X9-DG protein
MRRRGFTLVEVLVTIAVIAVLMGVLAPGVAGARGRGMQAVGQSNLRQLQLANALYANTNDDRFAPAAVDIHPPPTARAKENTHRWFGTRDNPSGVFARQDGPLIEYLDGESVSVGVRRDPAFSGTLEDLERSGAGFEHGCGGYGYNAAFVGSQRERDKWGKWQLMRRAKGIVGDDAGSRRSRFRSPSNTVGFADTALATDRLIEYSFVEPAWWPNIPGYRPDPSIHFRHAGQANVVWLDGHASAETRSATQDSPVYPAKSSQLNLGWFGDASSNELFDYR